MQPSFFLIFDSVYLTFRVFMVGASAMQSSVEVTPRPQLILGSQSRFTGGCE